MYTISLPMPQRVRFDCKINRKIQSTNEQKIPVSYRQKGHTKNTQKIIRKKYYKIKYYLFI